jgi:predicted acetyltransferase
MQATRAQAGRVTVRALEAGDGTDALFDLRVRAFGLVPGNAADRWQAEQEPDIRDRRCLGAFAGRQLVAAARFHDMTQWWNGRAVPMAGVAGVMVAPEERGRGVGRALVTALLEVIATRGYPLSVLFPSTLPIYRSLGWEIAGTSHEAVIAAHALRSLAPADAAVAAGPGPEPAGGVRRAGPQDAAEAAEVLGRVHGGARDCGPNVRDEQSLRLVLGSESWFGYLADDGLLLYTWREGHDEVFVQLAVAASAPTTRALWGIVGSHCWIAERARARVGPADPVWWLTREPVADAVDHDDWMLRVVDPAAAVAARGFPPAAEFVVRLRIADAARPANTGLWRLEVGEGDGSLVREEEAAAGGADGDGALTLGARGLAALYAGAPIATLRRAGLAAGGDATADALLDGAFVATPFMLDRF